MVQGPPSSDSEGPPDTQEYQYQSDGEQTLAQSARSLFAEAGNDYRCKLSLRPCVLTANSLPVARAALLAYTRFYSC